MSKQTFSIYLKTPLKERLTELADAEGRSLSNFIAFHLEKDFGEQSLDQPQPEPKLQEVASE